jgi:hypothetical protein
MEDKYIYIKIPCICRFRLGFSPDRPVGYEITIMSNFTFKDDDNIDDDNDNNENDDGADN